MADKIDAELERIRELLRATVKANRYTVRALEREMGITVGITRKILNGQITLSYRRVLEILDALGISWTEFFQAAYPAVAAPAAPSLKVAPKLGQDNRSQETEAALEADATSERPGKDPQADAARRQLLVDLIQILLDDRK